MLAEPRGGDNQTMVLSVPYKPRLTVAQALLPASVSRGNWQAHSEEWLSPAQARRLWRF